MDSGYVGGATFRKVATTVSPITSFWPSILCGPKRVGDQGVRTRPRDWTAAKRAGEGKTETRRLGDWEASREQKARDCFDDRHYRPGFDWHGAGGALTDS